MALRNQLRILLLTAVSMTTFSSHAYNDFENNTRPSQTDAAHSPEVNEAEYDVTIAAFKGAKSAQFFEHSYGYAVFPTIGKVGLFVGGGAYGKGRVYEKGRYVGDAEMMQASLGFQLGGQAFSQIIFFQDQRSFDEFTGGNFEFGATASAVIVNVGIAAEASTKGTSATANAGNRNVKTEGQYYKGMAVFSIAKGGLMYEAALAGQKFNYYPR